MKRSISQKFSTKFSAKSLPFLTKFFFFVFLVLIGYAIIAQTILIPRAISSQYDQQLKPDFKLLDSQFMALSKTTERPVYSDPYADVQQSRKDLLATQSLIAETELTLQNYERDADMLQKSPLSPLSEDYKKAEVTRTRVKDIFNQSREVMDGYKALNAYLLKVNTARIVLRNNTADINSLTDLNRLGGQGDIIAKRAMQLGESIETLKKVKPPTGFTEYHSAILSTMSDSQAGLSQLSSGLFAKSDPDINAGAKRMEAAIMKYEIEDSNLFITASKNSIELNEAGMLSDKADSLQPFLEQ